MTPEQIIEQEKARQAQRGGSPETPDDIITREKQRMAKEAAGSLYVTRDLRPDQASKVVSLADRMGAAPDFVERNFDTLEQGEQDQKQRALLGDHPKLSAYFTNPYKAAEAADSIPNLAEIESLYKPRTGFAATDLAAKIRRRAAETQTSTDAIVSSAAQNVFKEWTDKPLSQAGDLGRSVGAGFVSLFGSGLSGIGDMLSAGGETLEQGYRALPGGDWLMDAAEGFDEAYPLPDFVNDIMPTNYLRTTGSGLKDLADDIRPDEQGFEDQVGEALGQILGGVLTAYFSGGSSTTALFAGMGADQQAESMRRIGLNPDDMPLELASGATITGVSEMLRVNSVLRIIPKKVRDRAVSSVLARIAGQAGEEAVQETIEGLGQNLVTMGYDDEAKLLEGLPEQASVAGTSAVIFQALIEVALPGKARGAKAEADAEKLQSVREMVEAAPVFQRSRANVEEFIRQANDGETVYLDGEGIMTLFQSDPDTFRQRMEEIGLTEDDVQSAMNGSDIEIEAAKLLTVSEGFDDWVQITRTTPDAATLAEIVEQADEAAGSVDLTEAFERFQREEEALEGFERVERAVTDQLAAAGRGAQEAQNAGAIWGAMFRQLSEAGVDEATVFERLGLRVNEAQPAQNDAEIMQQAYTAGYEGQDQGEAREWVEAIASGLDMQQEARMARAQEQGFDTHTQYYHGTNAEFDQFSRFTSGLEGILGIHVGTADQANFMALRKGKRVRAEDQAKRQVLPLYVRANNSLRMPDLGSWSPDLVAAALTKEHGIEVTPTGASGEIIGVDVRAAIKDAGYDSIVYKNGYEGNRDADSLILLDENQIRSVNAAFDPNRTQSAELLAQSQPDNLATPENRAEWVETYVEQATIPGEAASSRMYGFNLRADLPIVVHVAPELDGSGLTTIDWTFMEREETGADPFDKGDEAISMRELAALKSRIRAIIESDIETHKRSAYVFVPYTEGHRRVYSRALADIAGYQLLELEDEIYLIEENAKIENRGGSIRVAEGGNLTDAAGEPGSVQSSPETSDPEAQAAAFRERVRRRPHEGDTGGRSLDQDGDTPRATVRIPGEGVLSDENVYVNLTKAADKTSFLHESAHIFLEMYAALESENTIIAERMATIRSWLGIEPGAKITRDQHEKFAESFEAYLMEGVAPSAELRGVFQTFRAWFVDVYRRLRGSLRNLDPEAREIFDRMLATDTEIEMARGQYASGLSAVMQGIMTPEQVEKYKHHAAKAGTVAKDRLFAKHIAEIKRREAKAYKDERANVEAQTRDQLMTWPEYKALAAFGEGGRSLDASEAGDTKLNTSENGEHPEIVAPEMGFLSADEMLKAVAKAPPFEQLVKAATDKVMTDRHGNMMEDGSVEAQAVEAVFNEPSIRMLEAERNALALKASGDTIPLVSIRKEADRIINKTPIDQVIKPGRYAIKARDLHKKSIRMAAKGKWDAALRLTHQAMLHHELARRAFKARDEIEKANRYLARFAPHRKLDPKKLAPTYIAQIRTLISLPGAQDQSEARAGLIAFAEAEADEGYSVVLPSDVILDQDMPIRRRMTLDQFREFRDGVKNLNKLARAQSEEAKAAFKAETQSLADEVDAAWTGPRKPETRNPSKFETVAKRLREFDSAILRWPFLVEALQGGKTGRLVDVLETSLRRALTDRNARRQDMAEKLAGIFKKHGITQKELNKGVSAPVIEAGSVKFEQIMAVALNMGTEQNRDRLASDPSLNGDMAAIEQMLAEHLEKRHWDAAQDVWNLLDTMWPEASAVERNATGVTPKKVDASSVETPFGTYRGGYYPLKYDKGFRDNKDLEQKDNIEEWKNGVNGMATRATTRQGFLKERQQNVSRPLRLSMDVILSHIDDVTNDIYMREPASNVSRVLQSRAMRKAVTETHGDEYLKSMEVILKRTVTGTERADNAFEGLIKGFRINASVAILGHNVVTAALAPISYLQTVVPRYGVKVVLGGLADFYGKGPLHTARMSKMITEKSAFMRERQDTLNREAHELIRKSASQSKWSQFQGAGYLMMTYVEKYSVSGPLWVGVYNDAISNGKSETEAITDADRSIATTQGSGLELDQTILQGGNEGQRLLTFMWGYVSGYYGIVRNDVARQNGLKKLMPVVKHLVIANLAASMLEALIRHGFGDEDDPYVQNVLQMMRRNVLGMVPGVSSVFSKYDSGPAVFQAGTKGVQAFDAWVNVAETLYEDGEIEGEGVRKAASKLAQAAGFFLGVPGTLQAAKIEKTLIEDDDPTLYEAIVTGPDNDN